MQVSTSLGAHIVFAFFAYTNLESVVHPLNPTFVSAIIFFSFPGGNYDAIIGRHRHSDKDGDEVRVSKEFIHPKYNERTTNNDFMVLKLSRETTAGTPVKINSSKSSPQDNQNVVVMGFGVTNENTQQTSNKLMEVTVKVVSDSDCGQAYGNEFTASTMICAASPSKDSCQGDSGGGVSYFAGIARIYRS